MDTVDSVARDELRGAISRLGLAGEPIEIHVSLRSFPAIDGGPHTLVEAFLDLGCTLLVPTMANEAFAVPAPPNDRPARNAKDYAATDASAASSPWPGMLDIYDQARTETDPGLGATPAYVAGRADRIRCRLSPGTFSAIGPRAAELIDAETSLDTFGPLRQLVALGGWVLLMGVRLDRMTILHLAEVEAGRLSLRALELDHLESSRRVRGRGGGVGRVGPLANDQLPSAGRSHAPGRLVAERLCDPSVAVSGYDAERLDLGDPCARVEPGDARA